MHALRSLVTLLWMSLVSAAFAEIQQVAPGVFEAGVFSRDFEIVRAQAPSQLRQELQNWCWAASIEMVLRFHGVNVSQRDIVQQVFGAQVDRPAGAEQILYALNGWRIDRSGRRFTVVADPYVVSGWQLIEDLAYRWPLIVGLYGEPVGHAYVLTAVRYSIDPWGRPFFHSVVLRDPWPGSPHRQEWSWVDFQSRLMFMARVRVSRI
jgi:hypothetical protein